MGKQRQHFQENFFFALFNIQNCLWKPLHPQSFDASYAPGGGSITKVRQAFLHMGMACISLRTYFSAPESEWNSVSTHYISAKILAALDHFRKKGLSWNHCLFSTYTIRLDHYFSPDIVISNNTHTLREVPGKTILDKAKSVKDGIVISWDWRHDWMSHSAKFCAYTIFCCTFVVYSINSIHTI